MSSIAEILTTLSELNIEYPRVSHPPARTMDGCARSVALFSALTHKNPFRAPAIWRVLSLGSAS